MRRSWLAFAAVAYLSILAAVIHAQPVQPPRTLSAEMRAALERVYTQALPASVRIETVPEGTGSGFFISADGLVMTAYHVVEDTRGFRVIDSKNQSLSAELVGYDEFRDIAILRASVNEPVPFCRSRPPAAQVWESPCWLLGTRGASLSHRVMG